MPHYAPRCEVRLAESRAQADELAETLRRDGMHVDVLDSGNDLVDTARNLYGDLRRADERGLDVLVAVLPAGAWARPRDPRPAHEGRAARAGRPRADRHRAGPNRAG